MPIAIGNLVMIPRYAPYPRYGHVAAIDAEGQAHVTRVYCGDPRCASEHRHGDETWHISELLAVAAYQPRAPWEHGRLSSPNAIIEP